MAMKVDYHLHTLCSDGIYTVEEVIDRALGQGLSCISITDHDTISGVRDAKRYSEGKLDYITGLEITCSEFLVEGCEEKISIHLLGYGFDEECEDLASLLRQRNEQNKKVFQNLLEELSSRGYPSDLAEIPISCGNVLQLCDILSDMRAKYPDIDSDSVELIQSFAERLTSVNISARDAIAKIHKAGGKAVWAHPFVVYHKLKKKIITEKKVESILEQLQAWGIDGMETDYLAFAPKDRDWLRSLANAHHLFCTAGSDFHGLPGREDMGVESRPGWI